MHILTLLLLLKVAIVAVVIVLHAPHDQRETADNRHQDFADLPGRREEDRLADRPVPVGSC